MSGSADEITSSAKGKHHVVVICSFMFTNCCLYCILWRSWQGCYEPWLSQLAAVWIMGRVLALHLTTSLVYNSLVTRRLVQKQLQFSWRYVLNVQRRFCCTVASGVQTWSQATSSVTVTSCSSVTSPVSWTYRRSSVEALYLLVLRVLCQLCMIHLQKRLSFSLILFVICTFSQSW